MALADEFAQFADKLRQGPNGLMSEIRFFPSGAVSMRIRLGIGRFFDCDYSPSQGVFGVGELEDDAGFNTGYRFSFHDFDSAKEKMVELLDEAQASLAHAP